MAHSTLSPAGGLRRVAFSTIGLPAEQQVELWESHNAEALIGLQCRTVTTPALDATEINVQLNHVHLARVRGSSHVVERDLGMIRRRPTNAVAMFFSLAGEAFFYHHDGVRTVLPGQMLLCDADRPFARGFSRGLEELVVKIPRDIFTEVSGAASVPAPLVVGFAPEDNSFAHALARHVGDATRDQDSRGVEERLLLELVAALMGRRSAGELPAGHRAAAQAYIDHHLTDPRLSAAEVASAVGISTRHLSRVFAEAESSVPRYILTQRLDAARELLAKPSARFMTIAEIARHCGFTSAAHFSSTFTAHFGERASDVKRKAIREGTMAPR